MALLTLGLNHRTAPLSVRERLAFLHGVGWHFPWLHESRVAERLRAWTRRRLLREVRRECGS